MMLTKIISLGDVGQCVRVRGRVASIKYKDDKCFWVLRQRFETITCTFDDETSAGTCKLINLESIVEVEAIVMSDTELAVKKFKIVSSPDPTADISLIVGLRSPAVHAIMITKATIEQLFRNSLVAHNFTEIHTPRLLNRDGNGLSMAIAADFDRVFEITASEDATTNMNLEMTFDRDYHEVLFFIRGITEGIIRNSLKTCRYAITLLKKRPIKLPTGPCPVITSAEAVECESDFFIVDKFDKSYDLFLRGINIGSGSQKNIHVNISRYGCEPHVGCIFNLEAFTQAFLDLDDARQSCF